VYVGTIHPSHYIDARDAIEAGKHVVLEKPACLNAAEWHVLSSLAKSKGVFLMEAVWTRFLPLALTLQRKLFDNKAIGYIKMVRADFALPFYNRESRYGMRELRSRSYRHASRDSARDCWRSTVRHWTLCHPTSAVDAVPSSGQSEERTGERTWVDVDGENRRRSHHHHLDDVPQAGCDGSIDRELCVQLTKG